MKVKFNFEDEFIEEIEKSFDDIDDNIVRVTLRWTQDKGNPAYRHIHLVATATVDNRLIILERYCGNTLVSGGKMIDTKVVEKAQGIRDKLIKKLEEMDIDVRKGVIQP